MMHLVTEINGEVEERILRSLHNFLNKCPNVVKINIHLILA